MKELQEQIGTWHVETFGEDATPRLLRKFAEEQREFRDAPSADEAADVAIILLAYCHRSGWDLDTAIREKFEVVRNRDQKARDDERSERRNLSVDEAEDQGLLHSVFAQDARSLGYSSYESYLDEECK